jgi:hypothetical protein
MLIIRMNNRSIYRLTTKTPATCLDIDKYNTRYKGHYCTIKRIQSLKDVIFEGEYTIHELDNILSMKYIHNALDFGLRIKDSFRTGVHYSISSNTLDETTKLEIIHMLELENMIDIDDFVDFVFSWERVIEVLCDGLELVEY